MNLKLVPLNNNDYDLFESLYCDNQIMRYLSNGMSHKEAKSLFTQFIRDQNQSPPACLIFTIINEQGVKVGMVGGFFVKNKKNTIYLGAMILQEYQNTGVSTNAISKYAQLVKAGFGITHIQTSSEYENLGATKLMQKLNYKLIRKKINKSGKVKNHWEKVL